MLRGQDPLRVALNVALGMNNALSRDLKGLWQVEVHGQAQLIFELLGECTRREARGDALNQLCSMGATKSAVL